MMKLRVLALGLVLLLAGCTGGDDDNDTPPTVTTPTTTPEPSPTPTPTNGTPTPTPTNETPTPTPTPTPSPTPTPTPPTPAIVRHQVNITLTTSATGGSPASVSTGSNCVKFARENILGGVVNATWTAATPATQEIEIVLRTPDGIPARMAGASPLSLPIPAEAGGGEGDLEIIVQATTPVAPEQEVALAIGLDLPATSGAPGTPGGSTCIIAS